MIRRILMPASGHQNDHFDSVHILLDNGRVPCGRVFAENLHSDTVETITCAKCRLAYDANVLKQQTT